MPTAAARRPEACRHRGMIYFPDLNPRTAADRCMKARRSLLEDTFGRIFTDCVGNDRSFEAFICFFSSILERCSEFPSVARGTCLSLRGGSTFPFHIGAPSNWAIGAGHPCRKP